MKILHTMSRSDMLEFLQSGKLCEVWLVKFGDKIIDDDGYPNGIYATLKYMSEYDHYISLDKQIIRLY